MGRALREIRRLLQEALQLAHLENVVVCVRESEKGVSYYRVNERYIVIHREKRKEPSFVLTYPVQGVRTSILREEAIVLPHEIGHHVSFERLKKAGKEEFTNRAYVKLDRKEALSFEESCEVLREEHRAWKIAWTIIKLMRPSTTFKILFLVGAVNRLMGYLQFLIFDACEKKIKNFFR